MTYSGMVVEALAALAFNGERDSKAGCSLVAIRKQILTMFGGGLNKQTASFNQLTLKGINKVTFD